MKKRKYKPAKGEPQTIGEWILLLILAFLIAVSCTTEDLENNLYPELQRAERGQIFLTVDDTQNEYNQSVKLDTIQNFTYTQIYAESTDMAENQKYNGEANIRAAFSTDKHWHYSDGVFHDYPVYYVYPTSVRFIPPSTQNGYRHEYNPRFFPLWTKQMLGPIPKSAIINRDTVKVYLNVSYDGRYHAKDSILIALSPK